jgi:hypothetical protein
VGVSFIIGTDGQVHSTLSSAGLDEARTVLDAVRFWRYRPGHVRRCANGGRGNVRVFQSLRTMSAAREVASKLFPVDDASCPGRLPWRRGVRVPKSDL